MKKKVLIFIDWYLPGYKAGGPIRSVANLVEHLTDEFEFSIITRDTDYCETTPYPSIKRNEWNILPNGVKVYYISEDKLSRSTIKDLLRKTEFDIVYLNGIYSFYFTLVPLVFLRKKHEKRVVIAARGMLSEGSLNVKKTKKQFFIRAVKVLKLFDHVLFHATTENEKEEIRRVFGNDMQIQTAGNLPQRSGMAKLPARTKEQGSVKLVNIARVAPEKNLLYALQVLRQVKGNVEFDFYGPVYDQDYWTECKNALDDLPQNIRANYKGSVESEKVKDLLSTSHFMFMPSTGENFGHIILQSLSAGCPVIISNKTPWNELEQKNIGWDIELEYKEQFSNLIERLIMMDKAEFDRISASAYTYANEYSKDPELLEQNRRLFL